MRTSCQAMNDINFAMWWSMTRIVKQFYLLTPLPIKCIKLSVYACTVHACLCLHCDYKILHFTNLGQEAHAANIRVTSVQMTSIDFKATNLKPATDYSVSVAELTKEGIKHDIPSAQVKTLPRGVCMHVLFMCMNSLFTFCNTRLTSICSCFDGGKGAWCRYVKICPSQLHAFYHTYACMLKFEAKNDSLTRWKNTHL